MRTVRHPKGFTAPSLLDTIRTSDGLAYPLTTSVVRLRAKKLGEETLSIDGVAQVVDVLTTDPADPEAGKIRYDWGAGDVDDADEYMAWWEITLPTNVVQQVAPFLLVIEDPFSTTTGAGRYTTVAHLKDFTALTALKDADDEWLAASLIPIAEAMLDYEFGEFTAAQATHPMVRLAANMLIEYLFESQPPVARERFAKGGFQSESLGSYSYTLPSFDSETMDAGLRSLLGRVAALLSLVPGWRASHPDVVSGSEVIFPTLPGYERDTRTGELVSVFDPHAEAEPHGPRTLWR